MRFVRLSVLVALIGMFAWTADVAFGAKGMKPNGKGNTFSGKISKVNHNPANNTAGTITVRKHKGNDTDFKTFTVDDNTTLLGKKPIKGPKLLDKLQTGHDVVITFKGTHALTIKRGKGGMKMMK